MHLGAASQRFEEVLRASPGIKIFGQITNLDDGNQSFHFPVRQLLVDKASSARPGMEVVTSAGFRYLLAENGDDHAAGVVKRTLLMIRLDRQDTHTRFGKVTDPVTGLERGQGTVFSNPIWYQARNPRLDGGVLSTPEARYSVITGADIRSGDTLGDLKILHVDQRLGVRFAEAR